MKFFEVASSSEDELSNNIDIPKKVRNFEHVEGNWASYVFVPSGIQLNVSLLSKINKLFGDVKFYKVDDPHISLSDTIVLKHHWLNKFVGDLFISIKNIKKFQCVLKNPNIYLNESKNRTFIGIDVGIGNHELRNLSQAICHVLTNYEMVSKLYETPSFHTSLFWTYGDVNEKAQKKLQDLNVLLTDFEEIIQIDYVHIKCGNNLYKIPLI